MNTTYKSLEAETEINLYQEMAALIKKNRWGWQSVCAVMGLAGGVIAPIFGAIFDVTTWFVNWTSVISSLRILSIVLCALTIPLLTLGAFCLDSLESKTTNLSRPHGPQRHESTTAITIRRFARPNANYNNRTVSGSVGAQTFL
jgi:hypothetical protein